MRVPVLTYHSNNVAGNDYADNDHVALAADLRWLHRHRLRIVPLATVVDVLLGDASPRAVDGAVALSFDDGSWFDWHDIEHPTCGWQRGFAGILSDFVAATAEAAHATSFAIVSPEARVTLDRTCLAGRGWWGDEWWPDATGSGLLSIQSHSWDHNHETLPTTAQHAQRKGTFRSIESWADADAQIRQAADWLDRRLAPQRTDLFAYPYGETSDYLLDEYFPRHTREHRVRAAFGTSPEPVTRDSPRWNLPRYVCGHHWRDESGLARLLADARQ